MPKLGSLDGRRSGVRTNDSGGLVLALLEA